ncbi:Crp/Fnr family transcriptional regulator [Paracoccus sp. (in: a-proteobacteria)]|uniref:Crp/Fnr family transcriptional regulator n=1 Tax=Paracoccus sp. TaxID=267 RepID=UPI0026E083C3|nr:cyclic nucleotide-binding domain-containing protein [Paracoccus sp. (in: a-proteobacteria)]MDO5370663.1 cyclic nucleotide-binding domain-containing protein [Paracoccus sp. (in: a-proteobacteria)]
MTPADLQIARKSALLANLSEPLQATLLDGTQVQVFETGQTIFLQDEPPNALFIVLDGWIKLYRIAASGAEAVVSVMTRGRSFGEAAALRGQPYPASAEAITPARLLRLDGVRMRHLLQTDPVLATSMLAAVFVHLQHLVTQIEELKARSGVQRVAEFLLTLSNGCEEGDCSVALPYNKALIAGRLGMKPETLSRAFAKLRQHGVRIEAAVAHIEDVERLRELVSEDPAKSWLR